MKLSRHAKSRMKLYKIEPADVLQTISEPDKTEHEGDNITALRYFEGKYNNYPLKVVYDADQQLVITLYPLKSKNWRGI